MPQDRRALFCAAAKTVQIGKANKANGENLTLTRRTDRRHRQYVRHSDLIQYLQPNTFISSLSSAD